MSQSGYGQAQQKHKHRKVSILLPRTGPEQHCSGINKVLVGHHDRIFTASRDSTIKRWQASQAAPSFEASYEGHCDWVNDLALVDDVLVSCSSDKTIKLWQADEEGPQPDCNGTRLQHTDYVTALAAAPDVGLLASASLGGQAFLWDVLAAGQGVGRGPQQVALGKRKDGNSPGSVYSLAMNAAGTVLAAGTAQQVIRICDARSGAKVMKLRGHTGNVRSVLLNAEGTVCISGAADRTIRVWDLAQQRCLHTLALHTDSVWCLAADAALSCLLSGGRDGCIYRTQLATKLSELVCQEAEPVQSLALDPARDCLWVGTTSSSLHAWDLGAGPSAAPGAPPRHFVAAHSALLRSRQVFGPTGTAFPEPQQRQPVAEVPGVPPLVRVSSLLDRRHILAQTAAGHVELWDIAQGKVTRNFGQVSFEQQRADLFMAESVSPWFALDCKLGSLLLGLEPPTCFSADVYAADLDITDPEDDQRFNYGEHLLRAALVYWSTRYNLRMAEKAKDMDVVQQQAGIPSRLAAALSSPSPSMADGSTSSLSSPGASPDRDLATPSPDKSSQEAAAAERQALRAALDTLIFTLPEYPQPVFMSSLEPAPRQSPTPTPRGSAGPAPSAPLAEPWRLPIRCFTGHEALGACLPTWAAQAAHSGGYPKPADSKCAFLLRPGEGQGLPAMLDARLTAPKVLRMHKVASYTRTKLQDQGIPLALLPIPLPPQTTIPADRPILEITCNGLAVPDQLTLAAIKTFIWKKSEDLVFVYRVRSTSRPAPIAQIAPQG